MIKNTFTMRIDSHQHFWQYASMIDPTWITPEMEILKQDFGPPAVKSFMEACGIESCVAVQADQSEAESRKLLELADQYDYIRGVVGWVDFRAENIAERLAYFSQFPKLRGFRHIVQAEPEPDFLLGKNFCRGIAELREYDLTYDILIYPEHLSYALSFVRKFPDQRFVIDHLAKPNIKENLIEPWRTELGQFRPYQNVCCKLAGLVTEAEWQHWKLSDYTAYVDTVLDIFGPERVMFGSDWPVCLTSASYQEVCTIVDRTTSALSPEEKELIWGATAARFYQL